jgi:pimeloyl-ACP methyl ester carboxylesterase
VKIRGGRVVSDDGTTIAYLRLGRGPRVVFLHGSFGSGLAWLAVARQLADRCELVLVDRRSHGASAPGVASLEREIEDLASVVGAVGDVACVAGHSQGALIALRAALRRPGLAPRLVLYEPPLRFGDESLPVAALARFRTAVAAGEYEQGLIEFLPHLGNTDEEIATLRQQPYWPNLVSLAPVEAVVLSEQVVHTVASYAMVSEPALFLVGTGSRPSLRRATELLAGVMPAGELALLDGQSHYALSGAPDQVADEILGFVFRAA